MSKVEENKRLKRNAMLDAAQKLFTDKGLAKTSVSDIVENSGVAKGTFYLYFKDKYDIRNWLISHRSHQILKDAYLAMEQTPLQKLEDQLVFICNHVLDYLSTHQDLLGLIARNLSWGILKRQLTRPEPDDDFEFTQVLMELIAANGVGRAEAEIMLYLIVDLVGSSCYSAILYADPCTLEALKPHLFSAVRHIVRQFTTPAAK